ncbi:type IV pilin protein [Rhodoferax aquaticus]
MVTVAIIGILASIALPSYQQYVKRGRIADALATLGPMQAKLEQLFLDNRSYATACGTNALALKPPDTRYFVYTCPTLESTSYKVTATGQGPMIGFAYSLSLAGGVVSKSTDSVPAGWTKTGSCWVTKEDGSC